MRRAWCHNGIPDCEVSLALLAAPCPCLSGDPTAHLLNAVSKPNSNMQTQLQEGGAGAFTVSHQRKVWGLFSNGKASGDIEADRGAGL